MTTGTPLALAGGVFMLSGESFARENTDFMLESMKNKTIVLF